MILEIVCFGLKYSRMMMLSFGTKFLLVFNEVPPSTFRILIVFMLIGTITALKSNSEKFLVS